MKIIHVCLSGVYNDGWGYQENVLSEYDAKHGNQVMVIASKEGVIDSDMKEMPDGTLRYERNGVLVIRVPFVWWVPKKVASKLKLYKYLLEILVETDADIVFFHGTIGFSLSVIPELKRKKPSCKIYVDNHADYYNCCKNIISKIFYKKVWRKQIRRTIPYVEKYFGTLPIRNEFMREMYGIPEEKVELLIMGIDEESLPQNQGFVRKRFREKNGFNDEDFLIVAGGKIDAKKNFDKLIDAYHEIGMENVKLLIFGQIEEEYGEFFEKKLSGDITFLGWISPAQITECFIAADLGVFPGLHSVLWEQAVASKLPCIFHKLYGIDHLAINGNCLLIDSVSTETLKEVIYTLYKDKGKYQQLKENANFAYSRVLYKNIEKQYLV